MLFSSDVLKAEDYQAYKNENCTYNPQNIDTSFRIITIVVVAKLKNKQPCER